MKAGFIGLGNVGAKLAGSLLRGGVDLAVHDINQNAAAGLVGRGARWRGSPRELAQDCDVIITCLPSPAICASVMEGEHGVLTGLAAGAIWLEMSTTDSEEVKRLGVLAENRGAAAMDAPVSGGCHRAETGNISILAGGERETFEAVMPLLATMGRRIVHTGPLGSASILKVITNYLAGLQLIATGEAFMVAHKAGIDLGTAYEAIRVSSGNSFVHETEGQLILNGSYDANFTMDLQLKDTRLFNNLAEILEIPLSLAPLSAEIMKEGLERYGARALSTMIVKRLEDDCGADLRADGFPAELIDSESAEPGYEVRPFELRAASSGANQP